MYYCAQCEKKIEEDQDGFPIEEVEIVRLIYKTIIYCSECQEEKKKDPDSDGNLPF